MKMSSNVSETGKWEVQPTGTDPNGRRKNSCKCKKGCSSSRTCGCCKFGRYCNTSCSCYAKCNNMFNGLDYFFGPYHRCTASPCFISYLTKNGVNGFEAIDRDELRNRILMNGSCINVQLDESIVKWQKQCNIVNKTENANIISLNDTQELFRLLLSNESSLFYSFCDNEMHRKNCHWHCLICHKCDQWRSWHCVKCKKCQFGLTNCCDTCGGSFNSDKI